MIQNLYLVNAYKLETIAFKNPGVHFYMEKTNSFPIVDMISWLILKYILSYRLHVCGNGYEVLMLVTELD